MSNPTIYLERSPDYEKNYCRARGEGSPCQVCGKMVNAANPYMIHLDTDDGVYAEGEEIDEDSDLGWYPIGNDCLKKHPELKPYAMRIR